MDRAARSIIEKAGLGPNFVHHTGHGVGFRYHEPIPFLHPAAKGKLEEGMVTSIEPGIYIEGWGGMRIEDNVVGRCQAAARSCPHSILPWLSLRCGFG